MNFSPTSNSDSLSISPPSVASSFLLSQITNSNSISSGNLMLQQPPQQQQKQQHNSTENMTSSDDIDPLAEVVVDRDDESMSQVSPITSNESPDECNIHSQKFELLDHQPEPQQSQQQSNNNDQLLQKEKEEEETVVVEVEEKKQDDENVILIEKRFVDDEEELVVVTQCEESQLDKTEEECGGGVTPTTASLLTSSLTTPVSASLLLDLQPLCLKQLMLQNNNSPTQQSQQQQPPLSPTNTMVVSSPPSFGKLIETSSDILCTTPNGSIITTTTTTTTTTITTTTTTYGGAGGQPTSSSANCASPPSSSSILEEMMKPDVFSISGPLGNSSDKTTAVVLAIGSSSPKELSGADQSPTSAAANATQIQSIPIVIEPSPLPVTVAPAQVVVVAEQQPPVLVISPPPISSKPSKSNQMMNTTPPMRRRCTSAPVIRPRLQRQSRQKPQHSMSEKPLLHAVLVQEEIKTLVNNDDINTRDNSGNSVLHRVSIIGHPFAIKHVIGRGARVNSVNNSGMTPLHYAACSNPHCVEVLLCYGSLLNSRDARGDTPLHYAVERGQQQIVSYLLFKGAKVNIINKIMERSAIHIASLKGYHTIIKLLLDYKINVNAADCNLSTPLHLVVYHSPQPNVSINPATYSQSAFTINSNMESYATCCEILLQRGADVYSQDIQGYTPLHIASRQGKRNLVDIILDYGKGYKGKLSPSVSANLPPSLYDKSKFKKEIKSELLLYIMDNKGRLPIHMAAIGGHGRILESMIGNGNKCLAIKDDMGMTPLCLASLLGNFDCVEFIYTIDPGLRNQYFKFFASSIDCSKSPFDPLGNDLKFALDGDYCDLVFSVDGREIYAHSVIVRQFKCFREMISYNKPMMMVMSGGGGAGGPSNNSSYYTAMSNSLHPNSAAAQHHPYYHHNPNGTYGFGGGQAGHALVSGSSYSRSQDDASSSSYNDYYDDDYSYNESSLSGTANHLNQMMGGAGGGRARSRSRQGSVTNPSTLVRIPVERGVSFDVFKALLHFCYTSELPREVATQHGKVAELLELANQYDIESLSGLCVDILSNSSSVRVYTLETAKYLLKQVNNRLHSDVTIVSGEGIVVHAHSVLLASRSSYFKLHLSNHPILSKSYISLFNQPTLAPLPATSTNNPNTLASSGGSNPEAFTPSSSLGGTNSPMRKMSIASSPAYSDVPPVFGWTIEMGDASYKAIIALLEYLYCGSIPSANVDVQPLLYPIPATHPNPATTAGTATSAATSPTTGELDVTDLLLLCKMAYLFNLPNLQQYAAILLYNVLDVFKMTQVIKTIYSFDHTNQGWGRSTSIEPMWSVCLDWMVKKCNWDQMNDHQPFLALGSKFLKEIKRERKDRKKRSKNQEKQQQKSRAQKASQNAAATDNSWIKMKPREFFRSSSKQHLHQSVSAFNLTNNEGNSNNNNNNNNVQPPQKINKSTSSSETGLTGFLQRRKSFRFWSSSNNNNNSNSNVNNNNNNVNNNNDNCNNGSNSNNSSHPSQPVRSKSFNM